MADKDKKEPTLEELLAGLIAGTGSATSSSDPKIEVPTWIASNATVEVGVGPVVTPGKVKYSKLILMPMQWFTSKNAEDQAKYRKLSNYLFGTNNANIADVDAAWGKMLGLVKDYKIDLKAVKGNSQLMSIIKQGTEFAPSQGPNYNYSYTNKEDAFSTLTQKMTQWLGRVPTKLEKDSFYKKLIAEQKKRPTISTTSGNRTSTTAGGITADEFATKYVLNKIKVSNPDLKGGLGEIQDALVANASRNGLDLTGADVIGLVKRVAKGEDINALTDTFRDRAKKKYTALADGWKNNPDATVYDLSSEYIGEMARMLEIDPNQITIKDIEPAIAAIDANGQQRALAPWEWRKQLRNDARYQYTSQAKQEAVGMAQSFARAFGVNI